MIRVSENQSGIQGNGQSQLIVANAWSPDGKRIVFFSGATNLDPNHLGSSGVFIKNLDDGSVILVSTSDTDVPLAGNNWYPAFSPDGTKVSFDSNGSIYVKNLISGLLDLVSSSSAGVAGDSTSTNSVFSPDGTRISFESISTNLVAGDTNGQSDSFIKNLQTGVTELVSRSSGGIIGNGHSYLASFSPDGTKVVFYSNASNLVAGDTNGVMDVFVKTLGTGAIERVSTDSFGVEANSGGGASTNPTFSPDGTQVIFAHSATNLVPGDTNGISDIFIKDLNSGAIDLVSTDSSNQPVLIWGSWTPSFSPDGSKIVFSTDAGVIMPSNIVVKDLTTGEVTCVDCRVFPKGGNGDNDWVTFSPDGSKIAFISSANDLVSGDTNGVSDVFVQDLITGVTERVSTDKDGNEANGDSVNQVFSPDGTKIAFVSSATNLVIGDTNNVYDLFVKDLVTGMTTRVSTDLLGAEADGDTFSYYPPVFSPDGTKIAFISWASNLVPGITNGVDDLFVKNLITGVITRVSTDANGVEADSGVDSWSGSPIFLQNGHKIAFFSSSTNLVPGDMNGAGDLFIKDLDTGAIDLLPGIDWSINFNVSSDGNQIVFGSTDATLVAGDTNGVMDIFVKNLLTGVIQRVSTDDLGVQGNQGSNSAQFNDDGAKVFFLSTATNLNPSATNGALHLFEKDLVTGAIALVSSSSAGVQANGGVDNIIPYFLSRDGKKIVFSSISTNLVAGDTGDGKIDAFSKNLLTGEVTKLSATANGQSPNRDSYARAISPDGSFAIFSSSTTNLNVDAYLSGVVVQLYAAPIF